MRRVHPCMRDDYSLRMLYSSSATPTQHTTNQRGRAAACQPVRRSAYDGLHMIHIYPYEIQRIRPDI